MSVLGPSVEAEQFLRELDEQKLVDLCADLLALEEHTGTRITDGPGDGGRDIHSRDKQGDGYLTQSKFHHDPSRTVSSSELWDVVRGMVKFGYTKGRFITNARISPQAKRECLNDYPGYSIDFIDGITLVRKVLDDLILRAIWYDGESVDRVSYVVVVPVVARDLESDRPLQLLRRHQERHQGSRLCTGRTQVQWGLQRSSISTSAFEPYRPPKIRTISEPGLTKLQSAEIILSGVIALEDVGALRSNAGAEVLSHIQTLYNEAKQHVAVRLGRPSLTPLKGESPGARIELEDYESITLVQHGKSTGHELEWIYPSQESGWFAPQRFSTSASDWARWYNPKIDACLDVTVLSPPSALSKGLIDG